MTESEASSLRRIPSPSKITIEHRISLIDHTISRLPSYQGNDAEQSDSDVPTAPSTPGPAGLSKRLTNNSIRQTVRQQYNKQKYSKYSQDRYNVQNSQIIDDDIGVAPQPGDEATPAQKGYIERAQTRAKDLLRRKKTLGKGDAEDTVIDVLYENQRGVFFFGIPKYSSASLLPSDPMPWQNGQFRTSAVDIRNAQVPDPSWEWAWKSWYVDMSRDVDEEGWEYSFAFVGRGGATFAWHGNHPWFHSFVRRRRWLRMRRRKDMKHHTKERAHELTADYFTIHPKTVRPSSLIGSQFGSSTMVNQMAKNRDTILDLEKMEISSIGDLLLALRKATVDREKILAVRKFIDEGGEEVYYLSDRMEDIMGTLVFQSSRRQLLGDLVSRHDQAHKSQKELASHAHEDDDTKQQEHDRSAQRTDNLLKAVHAADEHVKKLEYWSDIKDITDAAAKAEHEEAHNEPSFKNKQDACVPAQALHKHAEHPPNASASNSQTAYDAITNAPSQKSSKFFDSQSKTSKGQESAVEDNTDLDHFTTASESTQVTGKSKGKGKARALDGVAEATAEEEETGQTPTFSSNARNARRSVQIVDPTPESFENGNGHHHDDDYDDSDDEDEEFYEATSPPDRDDVKTPDSIAGFMKTMRRPKNWIDQAFG